MTVRADDDYDLFNTTSGFGNKDHTGHPQLTSYEVNPLPSTAPEADQSLQQELASVAAPMNVRQRFIAKRDSFQHSKHAIKKMSQSIKNFDCNLESKIGKGSTAEQLMESLRQDPDAK